MPFRIPQILPHETRADYMRRIRREEDAYYARIRMEHGSPFLADPSSPTISGQPRGLSLEGFTATYNHIMDVTRDEEDGFFQNDRIQPSPAELYVPTQYDVGNVRAICYSVENGATTDELTRFLTELSATFIELEAVIKIYTEVNRSLNYSRLDQIHKVFRDYTEKQNLPARRLPCHECKKEIIYWNLLDCLAKPMNSTKCVKISVCADCNKKLGKHIAQCDIHMGAFLLGKINPICPLYPSKCKPVGFCTSPECLHLHMVRTHKGYHERRWKASKRFLSASKGNIIQSDLMTGIEFEVIGKNKASLRTNIYKLGKSIGIDEDHSLHPASGQGIAYMATEVVTPPASGMKLEDIVYRVSNAIVKDGLISNNYCGLHIHIDLYKKFGHININPAFYKSLLAAYVIYEEIFYNLVPQSRSNNTNIRKIQGRYLENLANGNYFESTKFSKIWYTTGDDRQVESFRNMKRHDSKYYWANFHSLLRKEGLEIRLMEGTTDANEILWWTRFNHAFIERVGEDQQLYKRFRDEMQHYFNVGTKERRKLFLDWLKPDKELMVFIEKREEMHKSSINATRSQSVSDLQLIEMLQRTMNQGIVRPIDGTQF